MPLLMCVQFMYDGVRLGSLTVFLSVVQPFSLVMKSPRLRFSWELLSCTLLWARARRPGRNGCVLEALHWGRLCG